ncbi:hypothetical protein BH11ARM1_BH11ARM1_11840 [soil metagenome]
MVVKIGRCAGAIIVAFMGSNCFAGQVTDEEFQYYRKHLVDFEGDMHGKDIEALVSMGPAVLKRLEKEFVGMRDNGHLNWGLLVVANRLGEPGVREIFKFAPKGHLDADLIGSTLKYSTSHLGLISGELSSKDISHRILALSAMGHVANSNRKQLSSADLSMLAKASVKLLDDPNWEVRMRAGEYIPNLGGAASDFVYPYLKKSDASAIASLNVLSKLIGHPNCEKVKPLLRSKNWTIRQLAKQVLQRSGCSR